MEIERQTAIDIVQIALGFVAIAIIVLALIWRLLSKDLKRVDSARLGGFRASVWLAVFFTGTFQISHLMMAWFGTYSDSDIEDVWSVISASILILFVLFAGFFVFRGLVRKFRGIKAETSFDPLTVFVSWSIVMFTGCLMWSLIAIGNSIDTGAGINTGGFRPNNVELAGWATSNAGSQLAAGFLGLAVSKVVELLMDSNEITKLPTDLTTD